MDEKAVRRAALLTLRRAICERFPEGAERVAWLAWAERIQGQCGSLFQAQARRGLVDPNRPTGAAIWYAVLKFGDRTSVAIVRADRLGSSQIEHIHAKLPTASQFSACFSAFGDGGSQNKDRAL